MHNARAARARDDPLQVVDACSAGYTRGIEWCQPEESAPHLLQRQAIQSTATTSGEGASMGVRTRSCQDSRFVAFDDHVDLRALDLHVLDGPRQANLRDADLLLRPCQSLTIGGSR